MLAASAGPAGTIGLARFCGGAAMPDQVSCNSSSWLTGQMLGWHISVYKMVVRITSDAPAPQDQASTQGLSLTQMDSLRDRFAPGDRIAVWQTDCGGLGWIEELVKSGAAIPARGDGYPAVYYAKAVDVVPRLDAPPGARPVWVYGVHDVLTEKWAGTTVVDRDAAAACAPDEWLLIQAWDES
jgi:hypothetical protein